MTSRRMAMYAGGAYLLGALAYYCTKKVPTVIHSTMKGT